MSILTGLLAELEDYDIGLKVQKATPSILSVVVQTGTIFKITFTAAITGIYTSDYLSIEFGANNNFYSILSVGSDFVTVDNGTVLINEQTSAIIYSVKIGRLNKIISDSTAYAEKITRQSFSGTRQVLENYSGEGSNELILNRRPIISVDKVEYTYYPADLLSDITGYQVKESTGILTRRGVNTIFPKGNNNIRVTYTYGYATLPAELENAIIFLSMADALSYESGFGGGVVSDSVVAVSKSYSEGGKYSDVRKKYTARAVAILGKYKSGVVG